MAHLKPINFLDVGHELVQALASAARAEVLAVDSSATPLS
jgi:hypothetical protein